MKKTIIGILLASALLHANMPTPSLIEEETVHPIVTQDSSPWEQQLIIYGWLPTLNGTLSYQIPGESGESNEESDFSAIDELDAVFMASYEVRKDKLSFLTDVIYLGMSGGETVKSGPLATVFEEEFSAWLLSFYGGYNIISNNTTTLDIIGGMRYFSLDVDASITLKGPFGIDPSIHVSPSFEVYDAVVGVKGRVDINENWYIPYLFDIGAGDTDLTWQAQASIGYRFDWGDILATYRYLHYEKDGLILLEDFDLYGPKIGVVFHF